jgi:uncharacterized protein YprB with RNaseH-like and TPR domain
MKAYLDIETDREGNISVIGISIGSQRFNQFVGKDITSHKVEDCLRQARTIVTFNGDSFDLPQIKKHLNLDLTVTHHSHDLFKVKKKLNIRGGLKELEKMYGIERRTEGVNGFKAIQLWEIYRRHGRKDALELLLEYNKEDVLNLIPLEERFNKLMKEQLYGQEL